jgi:poly-gamma-glutamate capsule biosynthesis protein CapA/YwtB (metallophosphatase superfamily)
MPPTIGLLGDVMLGRGVADTLRRDPSASLWSSELVALAKVCDLVVCNLECCLSERGEPTQRITGKPFFFRGPPSATRHLAELGIRGVGLANNHALDYEEEALADTLAVLEDAGIATAGAGAGPDEARRGVVLEAAGARVGLLSASDHPAAYAAEPGVLGIAYADLRSGLPDWMRRELARLRAECDRVIAFPHWGPNMTLEPARWQRERAAELLAAGADVVAGHSAHVFHGVGRSGAGIALYDLGDALDDYRVDRRLRNDLGVFALWRPGGEPELELAGLRLHYCRTELAQGDDARWIGKRLTRACRALGTEVEKTGVDRWAVR